MKILVLVCRILLGAAFVFFGVNILHPLMNNSGMDMPAPAMAWMGVMMTSGWQSAIGVFQILGGLLVLFGGTLPLGLCILCPMTVNILLFHIYLTGGHFLAPGLVVTVLELILIAGYRANFSGILTAKATPSLPRG